MARKSSLEELPQPVLDELHAAIKRKATIDEIVWMLKGLGADVSRSAAGRYTKQYRDVAARQRDVNSMAKAFAGEFGSADDLQGRLMIQLATSLITRFALPMAGGDEIDMDTKELMELARAVKDVTSASMTDVNREAKIRSEAMTKARQQAAADAETAGKEAGASPETIHRIKAKILGVAG